MKLPEGNEHSREEAQARYAATKAVLEHLQQMNGDGNNPAQEIEALRERYARRLETIEPNLSENAYSSFINEDEQIRRLLQSALNREREALQTLRRSGAIHDEVFHARP